MDFSAPIVPLWGGTATNNQFVYYVTGGIGLVYLIAVLITCCSRRSRASMIVLPTAERFEKETALYKYLLVIDSSYTSGSSVNRKAKLFIQLIGDVCASKFHQLYVFNTGRFLLQRGNKDILLFKLKDSLGTLRGVKLIIVGDRKNTWRPKKVEVIHLATGTRWVVPVTVVNTSSKDTKGQEPVTHTHYERNCCVRTLQYFLLYHSWFSPVYISMRFGAYTDAVNMLLVFFSLCLILAGSLVIYIITPQDMSDAFNIELQQIIYALYTALALGAFLGLVKITIYQCKSGSTKKIKKYRAWCLENEGGGKDVGKSKISLMDLRDVKSDNRKFGGRDLRAKRRRSEDLSQENDDSDSEGEPDVRGDMPVKKVIHSEDAIRGDRVAREDLQLKHIRNDKVTSEDLPPKRVKSHKVSFEDLPLKYVKSDKVTSEDQKPKSVGSDKFADEDLPVKHVKSNLVPSGDIPVKRARNYKVSFEDLPFTHSRSEKVSNEDLQQKHVRSDKSTGEDLPVKDVKSEDVTSEDVTMNSARSAKHTSEDQPHILFERGKESVGIENIKREDTPLQHARSEEVRSEDDRTEDMPLKHSESRKRREHGRKSSEGFDFHDVWSDESFHHKSDEDSKENLFKSATSLEFEERPDWKPLGEDLQDVRSREKFVSITELPPSLRKERQHSTDSVHIQDLDVAPKGQPEDEAKTRSKRGIADTRPERRIVETGIADTRPERGVTERGIADTRPERGVAERGIADTRPERGVAERGLADTRPERRVAERGIADTRPERGVAERGIADTRPESGVAERGIADARPERRVVERGIADTKPEKRVPVVDKRSERSIPYKGNESRGFTDTKSPKILTSHPEISHGQVSRQQRYDSSKSGSKPTSVSLDMKDEAFSRRMELPPPDEELYSPTFTDEEYSDEDVESELETLIEERSEDVRKFSRSIIVQISQLMLEAKTSMKEEKFTQCVESVEGGVAALYREVEDKLRDQEAFMEKVDKLRRTGSRARAYPSTGELREIVVVEESPKWLFNRSNHILHEIVGTVAEAPEEALWLQEKKTYDLVTKVENLLKSTERPSEADIAPDREFDAEEGQDELYIDDHLTIQVDESEETSNVHHLMAMVLHTSLETAFRELFGGGRIVSLETLKDSLTLARKKSLLSDSFERRGEVLREGLTEKGGDLVTVESLQESLTSGSRGTLLSDAFGIDDDLRKICKEHRLGDEFEIGEKLRDGVEKTASLETLQGSFTSGSIYMGDTTEKDERERKLEGRKKAKITPLKTDLATPQGEQGMKSASSASLIGSAQSTSTLGETEAQAGEEVGERLVSTETLTAKSTSALLGYTFDNERSFLKFVNKFCTDVIEKAKEELAEEYYDPACTYVQFLSRQAMLSVLTHIREKQTSHDRMMMIGDLIKSLKKKWHKEGFHQSLPADHYLAQVLLSKHVKELEENAVLKENKLYEILKNLAVLRRLEVNMSQELERLSIQSTGVKVGDKMVIRSSSITDLIPLDRGDLDAEEYINAKTEMCMNLLNNHLPGLARRVVNNEVVLVGAAELAEDAIHEALLDIQVEVKVEEYRDYDVESLDEEDTGTLRDGIKPLYVYMHVIKSVEDMKRSRDLKTKFLDKVEKKHKHFAVSNFQNMVDSYKMVDEDSLDNTLNNKMLLQLEWDVTNENKKPLPNFLKGFLVFIMFLGTAFCLEYSGQIGGQLSITQVQEWASCCLIALVTYGLGVELFIALLTGASLARYRDL